MTGTWTYLTNPNAPNAVDEVRLAIGDTIASDPQLSNEEIALLLRRQPAVAAAAITACKRLAAHYTRVHDQTIGPVKTTASFLSQHYLNLAASLKSDLLQGAAGDVGIPGTGQAGLLYAGGLSLDEHVRDSSGTDLTQPTFTKHMHEELGTEPNPSTNDPAYRDNFFNPA